MENSTRSFAKTLQDSPYMCSDSPHSHLIEWVASHSSSSELASTYTLQSIIDSNFLPFILHEMCPEIFPLHISMAEMRDLFVEYFLREFGYYIKGLISGQDEKQAMLIRLILYACIYSPEKQKFVSGILKLGPQVQEKLVLEIQEVELQLKQTKNWDKVMQVVKNLEAENNQLKEELARVEEEAEQSIGEIKNLREVLEETKKQLNGLVVEKRKILGNYELSSLAQYQDLCHKLKIQNDTLIKRQQKYLQLISELEQEVSFLQNSLNNSDLVISELNGKYCDLQKTYDDVTRELSCVQESMMLQNQSKLQGQSKLFSKTLETTADMTMPSAIRHSSSNQSQFLATGLLNSQTSNFSGRISLGKSSRNSAAWNMFNTTKNNLLLNEKLHYYEEQIEQLKLKIAELEIELGHSEKKQRHYMKKNRKILKLSDGFKAEYEGIVGHVLAFQ